MARSDKGKERGSYKTKWILKGISQGIAIGIAMAARALGMSFKALSEMIKRRQTLSGR